MSLREDAEETIEKAKALEQEKDLGVVFAELTGKKLTMDALHKIEIVADINSSELLPLSNRNILFDGGLHLFYAPSGNMKSFTVASLAAEVKDKKDIYYFDFEYNPGELKRHCEKLGITYLNPTNEYNEVEKLLKSKMNLSDTLLIFDSFSYLIEEGNNDATETKEVVHEMRLLCKELGASVVYIDHATIQSYKDNKNQEDALVHKRWQYKVEGNESGKKKPCDLIYQVEPNDLNSHSAGVKIMCTKSRTHHVKRGQIIDATVAEPEEVVYGYGCA